MAPVPIIPTRIEFWFFSLLYERVGPPRRAPASPASLGLGRSLQSQRVLLRWYFLSTALACSLFAQKKPITIDTLLDRTRTANSFSGEITWAPDGTRFAYVQNNRAMLYNVQTKTEKE